MSSYAEIYVKSNATAQSVGDSSWTKITALDTAGEYEDSTVDTTNKKLTTGVSGKYRIQSTLSIGTESGKTLTPLTIGIYVNGVLQDNLIAAQDHVSEQDCLYSMSGIVDCLATQDVEIYAYHEDGTAVEITVTNGSLSILLIDSTSVSDSALTTTARFKSYAGITGTGDDTMIGLLINRATSEIQRYCGRDFISTTYRDFYDGDGGSELCLKHYPVTAVKMLGVGREDAFQIKNTSSDAYHAYVSVTDTTIQLVVQGGTNEDDTSLTLTSYATLTLLIAAIEALGKGWSVLSPVAAVSVWAASELLPTGKGLRCLDDYAALQIPDDPESDFTTDTTAGIVKLFGRFCRGFQNVVVRYTAGYATIPADIEQICIDLVKIYYDNKSINSTLQSERLGDYQYTNRSVSNQSSGVMPSGIASRLEKWRSRRL